MSAPLQAEAIQREMQHVRTSLGTDVRQLARQARESTDWRHYVRRYPWICMGLVAAAGYFVVPRKNAAVAGASATGASGNQPQGGAKSAVATAGPIAGLASHLTAMVVRAVASAAVQRGMDLLNRKQKATAPMAEHEADGGDRYRRGNGPPTGEVEATGAEPW